VATVLMQHNCLYFMHEAKAEDLTDTWVEILSQIDIRLLGSYEHHLISHINEVLTDEVGQAVVLVDAMRS
jgi:hypothetical protein